MCPRVLFIPSHFDANLIADAVLMQMNYTHESVKVIPFREI